MSDCNVIIIPLLYDLKAATSRCRRRNEANIREISLFNVASNKSVMCRTRLNFDGPDVSDYPPELIEESFLFGLLR